MSRMTSMKSIRDTLTTTDSVHTKLFASLIDNSNNVSLKCGPTIKDRFGPTQADFPQLGKKQSPFAALKQLPSVEELRQILLKNLEYGEEGPMFFPPPVSDEVRAGNDGANAAAELINNISNNDYQVNGFIPSLLCPELDAMCETGDKEGENTIVGIPLSCSVFSRGSLIPLQHHNETTSLSTILSGSIIWILWPPTPQNLSNLQWAYEAFAKSYDPEALNLAAQHLNGGVACIQRVGEGLRIPPYCIVFGLARETSVLATRSNLTTDNFIHMLRSKLTFLEAWWATEAKGEEKRTEFTHSIITHVQCILSGALDSYLPRQYLQVKSADRKGPLHELLKSWDEIKSNVIGILDTGGAEDIRRYWVDFLTGVSGRHCAICGKRFSAKMRECGKHFDETHWAEQNDDEVRMDGVEGIHEKEESDEAGRSSQDFVEDMTLSN